MKRLDKQVVIFGASGGALKVIDTLRNLGVDIAFFVDNDPLKWGSTVRGKNVKAPDSLGSGDYNIIIASDYQEEIEKQLHDMGLLDNLVLKEEYIWQYINDNRKEFGVYMKGTGGRKENPLVFIDLVEGIGLGGIETWSFMVAQELMKRNVDLNIISKVTEDKPPKNLTDFLVQIDLNYNRYKESIKDLVKIISDNLPCIVLSNWQSQVMIAAIIVKELYPEQIKLISVLHNDKIAIYRRQSFFEQYTDAIMCVSNKIKKHMEEDFSVSSDKLKYKESPVEYRDILSRSYSISRNIPLKIGFAARIDKFQKRADLLPKLIELLEEEQVNYYMEIAGIGSYYHKLSEYIEGRQLKGKIKLLGLIERNKMPDFWMRQDVFLSVSDFEGTSISMLEAMSYGVVPVVTEVSGVDEFVSHGVNGYTSLTGDMIGIKTGIIMLEQNRNQLLDFGNKCRKIVREKCNKESYINYVLEVCSI